MKIRACIAVAVLIVLSIGVAIMLCEPRYAGRAMSEWLLVTRNLETADSQQAAKVIRGMPKQKLYPVLRAWMTAKDSSWKGTATEFLDKQTFTKFRFLLARDQRAAAFRVVAILGPEAKEFSPKLGTSLASSQPENVFDAAFALSTIGADGKMILERPTTNGTRQAWVATRAAQEILKMLEFTTATQNWSTQTVADVMRWRVQFNAKCLGVAARQRPRQLSPDTLPQ